MAGTAMAEGYQINSLSTKQIGMGHTGVALKLGAENMYFNPAGMAYMDKTLDLTGSFTGIMPTATATVDGKEYETDNGVSTPISVNAAFSIYPNLKGGIAFYTPYGSSINWTDNWPGSVLNQNVSLKAFTIQPTLAWAINDKFSIGLGAMVTWATVDLNKGLVSASTADNVINAMKTLGQLPASVGSFGSTTPASVNLNGKTRIAVGFNIGAMYNVNDRLTFGASFRSKMDMKVKAGEAHVSYANELAQTLTGETIDLINNANFKAQMPCPWVLSLGASYKPVDRLTLAFDARLTGWHAYKSLDVEFLDEQLVQKGLNQYIPKHYKNSWCFSLGAQYALTERFDLRAGLMVDTSPVDKNYYNPETPRHDQDRTHTRTLIPSRPAALHRLRFHVRGRHRHQGRIMRITRPHGKSIPRKTHGCRHDSRAGGRDSNRIQHPHHQQIHSRLQAACLLSVYRRKL